MIKFIGATALAAGLALSAGPSLANITIVGGLAGSIPGGGGGSTPENDWLDAFAASFGLSNPLSGFYGSQLSGTATRYQYDVFGAEAGNTNVFSVEGSPLFTHTGGDTTSETSLATIVSDTLEFAFSTSTGGSPNPVTNDGLGGGNNDGTAFSNFFVSFGDGTRSGNTIWVFYDDGGAGPNDNHDDMVVRISAVPLPAGVLLLGLGLGGMAAYRRRQAA